MTFDDKIPNDYLKVPPLSQGMTDKEVARVARLHAEGSGSRGVGTFVPTREQIKKMRKLWRPRYVECKEQCASCPFGTDNDEEFSTILVKLSLANRGQEITPEVIEEARRRIRGGVKFSGEFICHQSVYKPDVAAHRPMSQWRQCSGASAYYRNVEGIE